MKALFLDIDGVLNCTTTKEKSKSGGRGIDPLKVELLYLIRLHTDCVFVLSSDWRYSPDAISEVQYHLPLYGCVQLQDVTQTTEGFSYQSRGQEIQQYLHAHPEITHYAIVDDYADFLEGQEDYLFLTDYKTGLTEEIANSIIHHLNTK